MRHIRGSDSTPPVDSLVAALARRQHGVVELEQLRAIGLGADAIAYRVKTGRLHRIHPGVYAAGHPILSLDGLFMAATLACGESAVLSHRSAAELHGLLKSAGARIEVSCPRRCRPSRSIEPHRTRTLAPHDVTKVERIPVTSVPHPPRPRRPRRRPQPRDRAQDGGPARRARAAGLRTARFTDARIEHEPRSVLEDLRQLVDSTLPRSS